jgi:Heat shock transcription factor
MSILDSHEHQDIISWLPHGRGFIIRDKKRLADLVLPKYFKESKYTSFTRRLNRWNFTIQTHGHKEASYFHPMFIQGDPQRVLEMHPVPQSAKAKRESRYIDDRRRMELGLDFAGSGGTMNSAVTSSSMGQVMGKL